MLKKQRTQWDADGAYERADLAVRKIWRHRRVNDQPDEGAGTPEPSAQEEVCGDEALVKTFKRNYALDQSYLRCRTHHGSIGIMVRAL